MEKDGLPGQGSDELAQLGPGQLQQEGRLRGRSAPPLKQGEGGHQFRCRRSPRVEFHLHGDGVAGGGGGQVGREEEAKHVAEQNVSGNKRGPTQL